MAAALLNSPLSISTQNPKKTLGIPLQDFPLLNPRLSRFDRRKLISSPFSFSSLILSNRNGVLNRLQSVSGGHVSAIPVESKNYEFSDGDADVELRLDISKLDIMSPSDIFVDMDETSLLVRVKASGTLITLMEANCLFERIKPSETIWYIDEDQLVVNLKKCDRDLKWPDVMESWESLTKGILQLLKGTSIYIVGDSTEINEKVGSELATGIGYIPFSTSDLLERYAQQSIESWVVSDGADSVAEAEGSILQSLSSHARSVVATLGGEHGAARTHDKWRYLHAGFTVWLSISEAADEASAKEEARRHVQDGRLAYSNADIVMKLGGWEPDQSRVVAQACLSALKQLTLSDKQLTGKKSLYVRLGCRGDWPDIKPPGWDPSSGVDPPES
uniref:CS domain-containing protein n=1 Tax=Musa acuminata subsp. malaccensis TaxID=214687 RepID=A0A804I2M0_MUSAM|nr:PREDICTED: probable inactive shikimate kinase like 2, chloroplastic [Musa acuminata subsp. malaccensis]